MRQFWRLIYPILIYFFLSALILLVTGSEDPVFNTMAGALVTIPVLGVIFQKEQKMRGKTLFAGGLSGNMALLVLLLGMTACIAVNNMISMSGLTILFPGFEEVSEQLYNPPLGLQLLAVGIVIPIAEELVFRALGFARLRDGLGFWSSALISSLVFGLYHGNVVQFVYAFILGLAMCWLYERSGSFAAPVLFHQTANLLSVVITAFAEEHEVFNSGISFYIMTVVTAVFALWVIRMIKRMTRKEGLA